MAAMLVVKNKNISFLWELNSIFIYTLWEKKKQNKKTAALTTNMAAMSRGMQTKNKLNLTHAA